MKTQINVRLSIDEKTLWKRAAGPRELSDWIRTICNKQAQIDVALAEGLHKHLSEKPGETTPQNKPLEEAPIKRRAQIL